MIILIVAVCGLALFLAIRWADAPRRNPATLRLERLAKLEGRNLVLDRYVDWAEHAPADEWAAYMREMSLDEVLAAGDEWIEDVLRDRDVEARGLYADGRGHAEPARVVEPGRR